MSRLSYVLPLATDYPLLNVFWTILMIVGFVVWIWLLIMIFADVFSRHDISGWAKAGWVIFVIVLPLLGVLVYLISQSRGMAERGAKQQQAAQSQFDDYVRSVASGPAAEIEKAKGLLDNGTISQAEFDAIKARALSAQVGGAGGTATA